MDSHWNSRLVVELDLPDLEMLSSRVCTSSVLYICSSSHKGMRSKEGEFSWQVEEELVWPEASSNAVVFRI